jgi:hypothetical protein
VRTSRQPASITRRGRRGLERGGQQVAEEAVGVVGGAGGHDDVAGLDLLGTTCSIQLSPGCSSTVTAVPETCAPA